MWREGNRIDCGQSRLAIERKAKVVTITNTFASEYDAMLWYDSICTALKTDRATINLTPIKAETNS